jgi:hypothetical protein
MGYHPDVLWLHYDAVVQRDHGATRDLQRQQPTTNVECSQKRIEEPIDPSNLPLYSAIEV